MATEIQFSQSSGAYTLLEDGAEPKLLGVGWAGHGEGKNNPAMQEVVGIGPLPRARYAIGEPFDHPHCGPFALRLTPLEGAEMFGRDGFLIHGPAMDPAKYGQESNGCAIAPHSLRVTISQSGARIFNVVE